MGTELPWLSRTGTTKLVQLQQTKKMVQQQLLPFWIGGQGTLP